MKKAQVAPLNGANVSAKVVQAVIALNLAISNLERANQLMEFIQDGFSTHPSRYWRPGFWQNHPTPRMKSFISVSTRTFESAQKALSLVMGIQSNEVLTESMRCDTSTNKNRVPYVASEMEIDWDEVQAEIESNDDRLRRSSHLKRDNMGCPNCKGCRREKAHFINNNSKPAKAHK